MTTSKQKPVAIKTAAYDLGKQNDITGRDSITVQDAIDNYYDGPDAIICDVDGTVALMHGNRSPFDWDKVGSDKPNQWVIDFFTREALRDTDRIETYRVDDLFGSAMRQEVSYWNPNRSKHAEVYWLENFVFRPEVSMVNRICNAMTVKFVGRPTTTLLACDTWDYAQVIDFEKYENPKFSSEVKYTENKTIKFDFSSDGILSLIHI